MPDKDLNALFLHQLKDTYYAENAIAKALPRFAEAAKTNELKAALTIHAEETRNQVRRLDKVFKLLDANPEGIECKAIEGILAEGDEVIEDFSGGPAIDAGLISAAQAVEHYEITRYGTLLAWAKQLELDDVSGLLEETLVEEENTDQLLSELAEELANPTAAGAAAA